jgi:choline kinase
MGGETPKTLLPVAGHGPLLHYILAGLKTAGIDDLMIVSGHRPQEIRSFVTSEWGEEGVTFVRNMRYASWGNFHSVRVALDQSPGMDVLIVNSDVIVHPDVYSRVAASPGDLVLAVQQRLHLDEEDMRVHLDGDRVVQIGKSLPLRTSDGEYAGVSLLRPAAARVYNEISTDLEWRAQTHGYYEDVYGTMLAYVDARAARVGPNEYAEIDSPEDVPAAAAVIEQNPDAWVTAASTAS